MEELTIKLHELGIEKKFTINKITKLIKQHEDRKQKSKELSGSKPVNYELTAKMIQAKNHKALIDQYKIYLGAILITTIKTVKRESKQIIKYKVPANKQQEYSTWLLQQVKSDPNFENFEQISHIKSNVNDKLNYVIDYLQTQQNSPRYLTGEMKTYVKKIIQNNASDEQIFQYIIEISSRIPFGILDLITRKITTKIVTTLPAPNRITLISKIIEKSIKLSVLSSRQQVTSITPLFYFSILLLSFFFLFLLILISSLFILSFSLVSLFLYTPTTILVLIYQFQIISYLYVTDGLPDS